MQDHHLEVVLPGLMREFKRAPSTGQPRRVTAERAGSSPWQEEARARVQARFQRQRATSKLWRARFGQARGQAYPKTEHILAVSEGVRLRPLPPEAAAAQGCE